MWAAFHRVKTGYIRFVEKQGFPIIVTVCVAVITATALWTNQHEDTYVAPTPPVADNVSAAQLLQQSLREAATPTPAPTEAPRRWMSPLEEVQLLRPFSTDEMVQSGVTGVWAIHDSVDLQANRGDKVRAISDGTVTADGNDKLQGVWLLIDHGHGIEALYAGMAMPGAYVAGDHVKAGAVIGFVGDGLLDEADLGPHLHLRVTKDGTAIDPVSLWQTGY